MYESYDSADAATAAYFANNGFLNGNILRLGTADQIVTLVGDAYVDAAGKDITVNGSGRLYGMDSGNDDYTSCAQWSLGEKVLAQTYVDMLNELAK